MAEPWRDAQFPDHSRSSPFAKTTDGLSSAPGALLKPLEACVPH